MGGYDYRRQYNLIEKITGLASSYKVRSHWSDPVCKEKPMSSEEIQTAQSYGLISFAEMKRRLSALNQEEAQ